jgi:tetratricopeptide (TPR) repeat protein
VPALAAQAMDSGSTSFGPTTDEIYKKAQKSVDMQRYREALADLQKVIKDKPKHADALNLMGYSHRKLAEYDLAVRFYNRALEADPKHRGANEYLGEAYLELNNLPEAEMRLELNRHRLQGYRRWHHPVSHKAVAPPPSSRASW